MSRIKRKPRTETRVTHDGRTILSDSDYGRLKHAIRLEQNDVCARCPATHPTDLHHLKSRGLAGCFRNDVRENLELLCRDCHRAADKKILHFSPKENR